jgi:cell wall-associated NlpC family hydrolase
MSLPKFAVGITLAGTLIVPLAASTPHFGAASTAEASAAPVASAALVAPAVVPVAPAPPSRASRTQARVALAERTLDVASKFEGVPYRFGGTTPRGFDCSGYTRFVFAKLGKKLPRTSQQQYNQAHKVKHPRVGDLLFYHSGSRKGPVYHVVIYAGNNRVWHAPNPGTRVKLGKIYAKHVTAGRY